MLEPKPEQDIQLQYHEYMWRQGMARATVEKNFNQFQKTIIQSLQPAFAKLIKSLEEIGKTIADLNLPDEKQEARQRSRDDLKAKRREMMKRRGRK